jgi:hypothetical protein
LYLEVIFNFMLKYMVNISCEMTRTIKEIRNDIILWAQWGKCADADILFLIYGNWTLNLI